MKRYPKVKYPGSPETEGLLEVGKVYIQEKLDGANFRFQLTDDGLVFGSRNTEGEDLARGQFQNAISFIESAIDLDVLAEAEEVYGDLVLFGEAMIPHTLSYDWDQTPEFVGFDVWAADGDCFLHPDATEMVYQRIGLPYVEPYDVISVDEWEDYDFEVPQSEFGDVTAEGVMFKNPSTGVYAKYVRDEFKERNKETFGASKKKDLSDTQKLVEEYVPPARVRSVAHGLVDDGEWNGLEMEMMADLPTAVIADMVEEEGISVFMSESKEVDLGEFRSVVSSRCATILRQMIDQQVREKLVVVDE